jgi:hypothetical protein
MRQAGAETSFSSRRSSRIERLRPQRDHLRLRLAVAHQIGRAIRDRIGGRKEHGIGCVINAAMVGSE